VTSSGQCECSRFITVTEAAALAAWAWVGRGDGSAADHVARAAMADELARLPFRARVVAGRGGTFADYALRVGDEMGRSSDDGGESEPWDLAVAPLEGHEALTRGIDGAMAMVAAGPAGSIMPVPEMYMQKIIVGGAAAGVIDIDAAVDKNVEAVAAALGKPVSDLRVVVLDRPRHEELIARIRTASARLELVEDGDVSAGVAAAVRDSGVDMCIGIGGSTEGIVTAAALRCLGGEIHARFWPVSRHQVEKVREAGIDDIEAGITTTEMVGDGAVFAATAVTGGRFLRAVEARSDGVRTETLLLCAKCWTARVIKTIHRPGEGTTPVFIDTR